MPYKFIACFFFIFSFINTTSVLANSGESLYQQCSACHGQNGEGIALLKAPAIAGQYTWYIERQLTNFKDGFRGADEKDNYGQQMIAITSQLSSEDISSLSAYIATLAVNNIETELTGDLKNGSRYYQGKCGACHGGQAQGNPSLNAPNLAGLSNDYLLRQMNNFSSGIRGTHKEDKLGRQMAMMAKTTSGKELADILYFISLQKSEVKN